jgi:hypothetical protein
MEMSPIGSRPSAPERPAVHHNTVAPRPQSVQITYDSSIDRYVSQIVAEGEVKRQVPTPEAVSFIRSLKAVVLSIFGKLI